MKFAIILGTRPEIIKLSSIVRYLEKNKENYTLVHTNQHYSKSLDKVFFDELELPKPDHNLKVGSGKPGWQVGKMIIEIEKRIEKEKADIVLVQGDTNSVLAGALAGAKQKTKVGHIEAGLRSYDDRMPEEKNRIITDHISDYLFAPTQLQEKTLIKEDINKAKVHIVGNTVVDAVHQNLKVSLKNNRLDKFGITKKKYALATVHRAENTDDKKTLENILKGLENISNSLDIEIILPLHPRTQKKIEEYNLKASRQLELIDPVGYLDFLQLMKEAKIIITDSGGIQEEACIIKTPCVTIRDNTERPETVEVGANKIAGTNPEEILKQTKEILKTTKDWSNPFGDGKSGKKIIEIIKNNEKR